ncbi:MAG: response regulator, partial [Cyanobacteria bacterium J06638_20]
FVQEAPELLQIIEAELLEIGQDCPVERVHALMRAAHTIKGGAANVGLEAIKTIAHRLEDYFRCLYNPDLQIDMALERLFLQGYDCLRLPLLEAIQVGDQWQGGEQAIAQSDPVFAQLQERLADFVTDEDHLPSVAEMGIDIAQTIFETDVALALERLESMAGDEALMGGELRAQAEVFEGIAELLNLSGLMAIARQVLNLLDTQPERAVELFPIALENFQAAHQAVLEGDRQEGGTPSAALQSFAEGAIAPPNSPSPEMSDIPPKLSADDDSWLLSAETTDSESSWFELPDLDQEAIEGSFFEDPDPFGEDDTLTDYPEGLDDELPSLTAPSEGLEDEVSSSMTDLESVFSSSGDESILDNWFPSEAETPDPDPLSAEPPPLLDPLDSSSEAEILSLSEALDPVSEAETLALPEGQNPTPEMELLSLSEERNPTLEAESLPLSETLDPASETDPQIESQPESESLFEPLVEECSSEPPPALAEDSSPAPTPHPTAEDVGEKQVTDLTSELSPPKADAGKINSIESAITAIQQDFDQLPPVAEPNPIPLSPSPAKKAPTKTSTQLDGVQPIQSTATDAQISVRLNLAQLERISNQLGELSINRNSLSLQNEQLQETLQELRRRFGQFLGIGAQLKVHLNKLLVSPERYSLLHQASAVITESAPTEGTALAVEKTADLSYRTAFDTLELDRYSEVYNLLQDATESIQQLDEAVEDVTLFAEQSDRGLEQQRQILTVLRDELMWARMLPLGNILNRFPRQIKDLSYKYNKPVALKLTGTEVLVDKVVLEKLYDPLLHLLRNAFDHGIESSDVRKTLGKPEQGTIHIRVYHRGSRTVIEIEDDGHGIDLERVRSKALEAGLLSAEAVNAASSDRLLNYLFEPGFSTAAQVSELSGRGVGLDIVRAQIQFLKGSITVNSKPGKGTLFTLRIPLTLSISKLLLTWTGSSLAAIPSDSIEEIVTPSPNDLKTSGEQHFLHWREQVIPVHPLQDLIPFNCTLPTVAANLSLNSVPTPEEWTAPLLILRQGNQPFALQVDRLITEQELVVKPFSTTLTAPTYLYGCTILGDGSAVPVIDAVTLLLHRQGNKPTAIAPPVEIATRSIQTTPTILIVDDAATMRQMLTLTLKKAGYQVIQARDGREALEQLHQHPQIRLVICDIEMPAMNGFEFLTHRRQNPTLLNIPVIMLTSRSGEKHRKLALHLGATHYFTKPYIEQQFLANIQATLANASPSV